MRTLCVLALSMTVVVQLPASPPSTGGGGTMSELMVKVLYPFSDALFYIETRTPKTTEEWQALEEQTVRLTESASLLMRPERARDRDRWMADARLLVDAGTAAIEAVKARDVEAIAALNDRLYESCATCHSHDRPGYGTRASSTPSAAAQTPPDPKAVAAAQA